MCTYDEISKKRKNNADVTHILFIIGTFWIEVLRSVPSSMTLRDHEHLVSVSAGTRSIWLLTNTGRAWFNTISALIENKEPSTPSGGSLNLESVGRSLFWSSMAGRLICIAVNPFDHVST